MPTVEDRDVKNRLLLLGFLAFVVVENGLLLYLNTELRQVRAEMGVLQEQVAQLRVWRTGLGNASPTSSASPAAATAPIGAGGRPAPLLARVLAGLVVLRQAPNVALDRTQIDHLHRHLDAYQRDELPVQRRLAEQATALLTAGQQRYLDAHAKQVAAKADELARDESSLPDMIMTFVREAGAHL